MFARKYIFALAFLTGLSCTLGAEEALEFPTYVQASATLPGEITCAPVLSGTGNYATAAVGDSLYHMELQHGRVHGKTSLPGVVSAMFSGSSGEVYVVAGDHLCRVESFQVQAQVELESQPAGAGFCGEGVIIACADGRIELRDGGDLAVTGEVETGESIIEAAGLPGYACLATAEGKLLSYSVPELRLEAENTGSGEILFLNGTAGGSLLFSRSTWNEAASCSPEDLVIDQMFTFPLAPVYAEADSATTFLYAVVPDNGIQVCRSSGEVAWRMVDYGSDAFVTLAPDRETALISSGNRLDILVR